MIRRMDSAPLRIGIVTIMVCTVCTGQAEHPRGSHSHEPRTTPATRSEPHPSVVDPSRVLTSRSSPVEMALPTDRDAFSFVVFGDRTGGVPSGLQVLRQAVADTNLVAPDLVMTVGDLIQGYCTVAPWLAQAAEFRAIMAELRMPWFPVAGNHDVYWRGPDAPPEEHEGRYEEHFGPLWYAFEHKRCWFIVLYTDEPNPETGERNFHKPECQRISPDQLTWLQDTLAQTRGARHVFVFAHHPRWLPQYGEDWERVHERLAANGNVSAVFAGHIHHMRYSGERDGIEYFTTATVGAAQWGKVPGAGFLDEFHLVTVRSDGIDVVAIPVGSALDPRAITDAVAEQAIEFARGARLTVASPLTFDDGFGVDGAFEVELSNPTQSPVEYAVRPTSQDPRWSFTPEHQHVRVEPGSSATTRFVASHPPEMVDGALSSPIVSAFPIYFGETTRFELPTLCHPVAVALPTGTAPRTPERELALRCDGVDDCLEIHAGTSIDPASFTFELWLHAHRFRPSVSLISSAERSGLELSLRRGQVELRIGDAAAVATSLPIPTDHWTHVAVVGTEQGVELFVAGVSAGTARPRHVASILPCAVASELDHFGSTSRHFVGKVDELRISATPRYDAPFEPMRRFETDEATLVLLHFDDRFGDRVFDHAERSGVAFLRGLPAIGIADPK